MIESMPTNNWQMPNVNSPSGSVDSGIAFSPQSSYPYGNYEDHCGKIFSGGSSPECGSGSVTAEQRFGYSPLPVDSFTNYSPEPLTQHELDALSEINDECLSLSPCSVDNSSSVVDLREIGQIGFQQRDLEDNLNQESFTDVKIFTPVINNTNRRKERQKIRQRDLRQSHPGVDLCLVPKSGTAKPRQSRKKRKAGPVESMTGASMNPKKCYTGARVKETARERLQKMRSMQREHDSKPSKAHGTINTNSQISAQRSIDVVGERNPNVGNGSFRPLPPQSIYNNLSTASRQHIPHSVEQILQPTATASYLSQPEHRNTDIQGRCDTLDQSVNEMVYREDTTHIQNYIEQAKAAYNFTGQTPFHEIIDKLNQKLGVFTPQQFEQVTEQVCKLYQDGINRKNFQGETPIYRAALFGNLGATRALMKYNADPYIQESSAGENALHAAVKSKNIQVVDVILSKEVHYSSINSKTYDGNTALHKATALRNVGDSDIQREIVVLLLKADADPSIKNNMNEMAHSFLPDELKELQQEMRRMNGRKRTVSHPQPNIPTPNLDAYARTQVYRPQYQTVTPEILQQMHYMRAASNAFAHPQQFQYRPQHTSGFTPVHDLPQLDVCESTARYSSATGYLPRDVEEVLGLL